MGGFAAVRLAAFTTAEADRRLTLLTAQPIGRIRLLAAEVVVTAAGMAALVTVATLCHLDRCGHRRRPPEPVGYAARHLERATGRPARSRRGRAGRRGGAAGAGRLVTLAVVACALVVVGFLAFRRRDVPRA